MIYLQSKIYIISVELCRKIVLLLVSCNRKEINFKHIQSYPFKYRIQNLPHRRFYQLYTMNYKSSEIEQILFDKQIQTYTRIMDLINHDFDNMDEERLSILLRNCIDMFGDIQIHIKNMKSREMYY
jgi:hypothetical protein